MGSLTNIISRMPFRSTYRDIDRLMEDVRTGKPVPETRPNPKFSSRVIWPTEIAGKPLFDFVERPQSIVEKVRSFGIGLIDKNITAEVLQCLEPPSRS